MKKFILFYRENTRCLNGSMLHLTRVFNNWRSAFHLLEVEFNKNWAYRFTILLLVFGQITFYGQSNTNNSQWGKNGPASAPASPVNWANGNAQGSNSHFTEGQSIPTRIELAGLTVGQPASVTFNINITQGNNGQHAFDFFTGPNRIEEVVQPLDGLTGYNPVKSTFVFPIPNAGNTGGVPASYYNETALKMACQQNADAAFPDKNSIWIYNGTVSNITYVWGNENASSTQQTYCTVTFTPTSTKALLVLGCHIAAELTASCEGWGVGNGASTISGSPYHFHIHNVCSPLSNCVTLGSQDQQMASSSVIVPPTCSISPSSAQVCAGATATFTATGINGSGGAPYTFAWTGPNGFSATTASITVGVAGTYSVIVSDKNGVPTEAPCTANLVVNNNPTPSVDDEEACAGSTATFSTASVPGFSYQWYLNNALIPGATSNSYTTPALAQGDNGGVYKVIVIDGNHDTDCDGEDSGILTVNALPTVAANDASVCAGFTVQLSASPEGGTWSGDHISASGLFDSAGLAPGMYNVTYTYTDGNQCTNNDDAVVTVNALPTVVANDASVCAGFTVELSASPEGGTWSGDHISASGLFDSAGLAPGMYNVTYTYTDGNQCTNSDDAVVTVNDFPEIVCPTPALFDVDCGVSASVAQAATDLKFNTWFNSFASLNPNPNIEVVSVGYVYSPSNAEPEGDSNALLNPIIGVPGSIETSVTVTWTIRNTETGCESSCSSTFTMSFNCRIGCQTTPTPVACNGESSGSIQVQGSNGIPPYNFYLYNSNDLNNVIDSVMGVNDEPGGAIFSNLPAGTYTILITDAVQTLEDATACDATISQPDALSLLLDMEPENCSGTATGSIEAVFSGGTPPYMVSIDGGSASEQSSPYTFAGLSTGNHTIKIVDANGCEISDEINVGLVSCDDAHCTYTQGFYGNVNGLGCTPNYGTVGSHVMMTNALNQVGGLYNFGSTFTGNYFQLKLSDVDGAAKARDNNIYKMLPGGGTPRSLVGFATYQDYSTWSDNDPLNKAGSRKGAINNNLLSQTMTLFFNLQVDPSLASFVLESSFATAKTVTCGSNEPNMESVQVFNIPQGVITYLSSNGGATVGNLFILANKALGGENIGGLSHSNVNAAVDAINRGFDECRVQVGIPEEVVGKVSSTKGFVTNAITSYPNPFREYIGLNYMFDYDSNVEIQIFDIKGALLYEYKDTEAYYGKEFKIDVTFNRGQGEMFILKLITNKETIIKKVVSSNF